MPIAVKVLIGLAVTLATGILATVTVGAAIKPHDPAIVGFAVALLSGAGLAALLFSPGEPPPGSRLGLVLVVCGAAVLALALVVQMVAVQAVASTLQTAVASRMNVNMDVGFVRAVSWFACLASVYLVGIGIRYSVGPARPVAVLTPLDRPAEGPLQPGHPTDGIRAR